MKLNDFNKRLNFEKTYIVNTNPGQIKDSLQEASQGKNKFNYKDENTSENSFSITARVSFGVLTIHELNMFFKPISIYGNIYCVSNNKQVLSLKTKLRLEIIVLAILAIPAYVFMIINYGTFPAWLFLLPCLVVLWFFFVYRQQEKALLRKIERELMLMQHIR